MKTAKTLVDLGCGSGILSIIAKENGGFNGNYTMLDENQNALDCTKMNMELYGQFDRLNFQNTDIVDLWFPVTGTPDDLCREKHVAFYDRIS